MLGDCGESIGNDSVIDAGSVVTKDISDGVIAAENPCRVMREISEQEKHSIFLFSW